MSILIFFSTFCNSIPFSSSTAYFIVWFPYDILLKSNVAANPGFGFDAFPPYPGIAFNTSSLSILAIIVFVSFPSIYIFKIAFLLFDKNQPATFTFFPLI